MREVEEKELKNMVRYSLKAALDFLIPRKCAVCECVLGLAETHICSECLDDLPRTYYWLRKFNPMADKFNALIQKWLEDGLQAREDDCLAASEGSIPTRENYAYAAALFFYRADSGYTKMVFTLAAEIAVESATDGSIFRRTNSTVIAVSSSPFKRTSVR